VGGFAEYGGCRKLEDLSCACHWTEQTSSVVPKFLSCLLSTAVPSLSVLRRVMYYTETTATISPPNSGFFATGGNFLRVDDVTLIFVLDDLCLHYGNTRHYEILHGVEIIVAKEGDGYTLSFSDERKLCGRLPQVMQIGERLLLGRSSCCSIQPADPVIICATQFDALLLNFLFGVWPSFSRFGAGQWAEYRPHMNHAGDIVEQLAAEVRGRCPTLTSLLRQHRGLGLRPFQRFEDPMTISESFLPLVCVIKRVDSIVWPECEEKELSEEVILPANDGSVHRLIWALILARGTTKAASCPVCYW